MSCLSTPRALRLAILTLLALFALPLMSASAQEATAEPETYEEKVAALLCTDRSCLEFGPRIPDFTINVVDINTDEVIDSCVTDASTEYEGCLVTIPVDAQWTLGWDEAQVPEGYEYRGSLMGVSGGAFGSITYLGFIPLEEPPQDDGDDDPAPPVSDLPSTGTTSPEGASGPGNLGSITLAVVTLMLAGTAIHLRRR
jgi:hypothetical protein